MTFDAGGLADPPDDARQLADRLARWLAAEFGGRVDVVGRAGSIGGGFDSAVHTVQFAGTSLPPPWRAPLILRVKSDAGRMAEAEREAAVQEWVAAQGFPAPQVLRVFAPGELGPCPVQVVERAPGMAALDVVRRRPWRAPSLMELLARRHADLHRLDPSGFPPGEGLLERRLMLVRFAAEALDDDGLRRGIDGVLDWERDLRSGPDAVCHGDFHPLNVIVDGDEAAVVDWTDAGVGDRHGDVARTTVLFEVASIAATSVVERAVLGTVGPVLGRRYLAAYRRHLELDDHRIAIWRPVHLLHGWSQARCLHEGIFSRGADDDRTDRVPPAFGRELERRFYDALAALA